MTIREAALRRAITQLGVTEHPPGSNDGPDIRRYRESVGHNIPPGQWCMYFAHWCFAPWVKLGGWGSVEGFDDWATAHGQIVQRPFRGDLVCYDWNADNWDDHVGIVERVLALRWRGKVFVGWVRTVEGNTSDQVARRTRWIKTARFARVPGSVEDV